MTPVRALIADDYPSIRQYVQRLVEEQEGWIVCGEATTGREAVLQAVAQRPDVVVIDLSMPELNDLEATRGIRAVLNAKILILTSHDPEPYLPAVLDAGGDGCVSKWDMEKLVPAGAHPLSSSFRNGGESTITSRASRAVACARGIVDVD